MDGLLALAAGYRTTFLLVFFRVGAMAAVAPILGHRSVPVSHRAGLAVLLALLLTPVVAPAPVDGGDGLRLILAIAGEVLVGVVIGGIATLVVAAVQVGGELVGFQMGLGMGAVYDPTLGEQATVFTRLQEMLALLLFLAVDGHHVLLAAVAGSLHRIQPGAAIAPQAVAAGMAGLGAKVVRAGLELAAPLVGVLFVVNAVMGLLARVSPQMNVFALVMPVAMGAALVATVAVLPSTLGSIARLYAGVPADITLVLGHAGARAEHSDGLGHDAPRLEQPFGDARGRR
jgi:flagellar biosynthetic protein FliR